MSPHKVAQRARILGRQIACPREALAAMVAKHDHPQITYASLSRMIGKRNGYLACFVREGHPVALDQRSHRMLANFFGASDRDLGIRDLWAPADR